jgi:hypothetical protein
MNAIKLEVIVPEDRQLTITLPSEIPLGKDEFWTTDRRLAAVESRIALQVLPNTFAQ